MRPRRILPSLTWPALALPALTLSALVAACGGSASHPQTRTDRAAATAKATPAKAHAKVTPMKVTPASATLARRPAPPDALVTAETENRLLVVAVPSGRVIRRIALPRDPEDVAAAGGVALVTSGAAGETTLLKGSPLRPVRTVGGFATPHIVEIAPGGRYAYVTDDTRGTVTVIDLKTRRVTSTLEVGAGAHHISFDPVHHRAWVALSQSASTIAILSTADPAHPRVVGHFQPGYLAHDLAFEPNGRRVWVTSANGPETGVFDPSDERLVLRVPAGPPPQHVALDGPYAYLTSGYGSTIERVDAATGRILAKTWVPYGSFELAAGDGYVVTSSLLRGTLAIYTTRLKLLRVVHLAPVTREVALSSPAGSRP